MTMIDAGTVTMVQNFFLQHLIAGFQTITIYATHLLYIFAVLEIVLFGLFWALQQNVTWGRLFFKVLKIGLILFVLQNYFYLIDVIIRSFAQVGASIVQTKDVSAFLFNPALFWRYGYDIGVSLLKSASVSSSIGLTLIEIIMGFGILFSFGLFGIQILFQLVAFYVTSLFALLFLPLGVFDSAHNFFEQAVKVVLKAGVRVCVMIMIVSLAIVIFGQFDFAGDDGSGMLNINQYLGLLFTSVLFLYLAMKLPSVASETVGNIMMRLGDQTVVVEGQSGFQTAQAQPSGSDSGFSMQAATMIGGQNVQAWNMGSSEKGGATANAMGAGTTLSGNTGGHASSGLMQSGSQSTNLSQASMIGKQIGDKTAREIRNVIKETLNENKNG